MNIKDELKAAVLNLDNSELDFERLALEIFNLQANSNQIYKAYLKNLNISPKKVNRIDKIPFLPISFFKTKIVSTGEANSKVIFESSGTTASETSKHYVSDLQFYESICQKNFEKIYGDLSNYTILALLPSYLERNNSSLVYMVQSFINKSYSKNAGFFMNDLDELMKHYQNSLNEGRKILLLGVSFALLDLADSKYANFIRENNQNLIVMETGGMKGRKKEMVREELHSLLKKAFGLAEIHSEYGMTELFSQAYAPKDGKFIAAPSMKIFLREVNDPLSQLPHFSIGQTYRKRVGGVNIIDLANIDSCCFIETKDLGNFNANFKTFSIDGRFDNSDIRGCNLLSL